MRIAFTHNLDITGSEEEAEFDSPETVRLMSEAMRRLGHDVDPVEVSGPASLVVARLEAMQPDLVFNTAEGRHGRCREAFYPGLFEQLDLPYTGSCAYVCTLTLDKQLSKMMAAAHGVPTPRWAFVEHQNDPLPGHIPYPLIVKPNFEGSSKGITEGSVVADEGALRKCVRALLARYPSGLLVEEYIDGHDVVVPFLEGVAPASGGVLPAVAFRVDPAVLRGRQFNIYDFDLKHRLSGSVDVVCPADLDETQAAALVRYSRTVFRVMGCRDLGRADFRVDRDGRLYFLEVNALPSLEPGAGIYAAAEAVGLATIDAVLEAVIRSAASRNGVRIKRPSRRAVRVGLVFNLKRSKSESDDREAEFDAPETVAALRHAIESFGHHVVELEANRELPTLLPASEVDLAFNLAEGLHGRGREAVVPALLEHLDIPYTGSDPAVLAVTLDKGIAKRIVREAGVPTAPFVVMFTGRERLPKDLGFPAIVKPVAEGSSKGVVGVVHDEKALRKAARGIIARYDQGALVESFLPGREFTVGLLGDRRPRVLPPMEVVFADPDVSCPIYAFEHKLANTRAVQFEVPAKVDPALGKEIARVARASFVALGCRDVARIDLRLDAAGRVCFIECNPLPGLTPGFSDLCVIAEAAGLDYRALVGEILAPALRRLRRKLREDAR